MRWNLFEFSRNVVQSVVCGTQKVDSLILNRWRQINLANSLTGQCNTEFRQATPLKSIGDF